MVIFNSYVKLPEGNQEIDQEFLSGFLRTPTGCHGFKKTHGFKPGFSHTEL